MKFLVIEGNIGSGKTTLAGMLAKDYNAKLILEQFKDNPYLTKFYQDSERYSFLLELSFLTGRYNQIKKKVLNARPFSKLLIADYYFAKTAIFAQNTLNEEEYLIFCQIYDIVSSLLPKPDLYVYLDANTDKLLNNIKKRGREYEKNISAGYLKDINNAYLNFLKQTSLFPILIININSIDFANNPKHYKILKDHIQKNNYKLGINHIILP